MIELFILFTSKGCIFGKNESIVRSTIQKSMRHPEAFAGIVLLKTAFELWKTITD